MEQAHRAKDLRQDKRWVRVRAPQERHMDAVQEGVKGQEEEELTVMEGVLGQGEYKANSL